LVGGEDSDPADDSVPPAVDSGSVTVQGGEQIIQAR